MAAPGRRADPSLEEALFDRGFEFEFFQAVRLLARLFPERQRVGEAAKPSEEVVRFGGRHSLAFPPSAVHDIERPSGSPGPVRMTVAFMGLTGTQGVLPLHYTEYLIARKAAKDHTLADFFDLFTHRFVSLFYRAWEKHRPPTLYESSVTRGQDLDPFTQHLFDCIGMGTDRLRGRMRMRDESLLLYAGLLAHRPPSASALRGVLTDYFSLNVEIDQCLGEWYRLEEADRCQLSGRGHSQLGEGAVLGDEVWNQQARFRIRLGPMDLRRFKEFLPDGPAMAELVELTRLIAGQALAFDVQVLLRAADVPFCRLDDEGFDAPRLGLMAWLKTDEFEADAGDAVSAWVC